MALLLGRHSSLCNGRGCRPSSSSLGHMQDRYWVIGPYKCYGRDPIWDCYHTGGLTSRTWKWGFLSYCTFLWVLDTQVPILPYRALRLDTVYLVRLLTGLIKIGAFELWCWRRLLRVPWTARRSNQSILKEISPGCSLEGLMLKLKLQYFGHLMQRADSFEKTLMLGKIEGRGEGDDRGWDGWMASLTWWTWVWENSRSWWWAGRPGVLRFMGSQRVIHDWVTELTDWQLAKMS